jgi:hypothetical protein
MSTGRISTATPRFDKAACAAIVVLRRAWPGERISLQKTLQVR